MDSDLLAAVRAYADRGWCIIPMCLDTKRPAVRWKRYQSSRPTASTLNRWFGKNKNVGAAVVYGDVSGYLGARDFDDLEAYNHWAAEFPSLAKALPTVCTRRGRHVYFRMLPKTTHDIRVQIGKPHGTGAIHGDDGELRIGSGCYCLIPPSPHPKGGRYAWDIPPDNDIPLLTDVFSAGLWSCHREDRVNRGPQKTTDAICCDWMGDYEKSTRDIDQQVQEAIAGTLPNHPGQRNRQIFEFARWLKSLPGLCEATAKQLEPYVRQWHRQALPVIDTKPVEETLIDFHHGWENVKYPKGQEPMTLIFAKASACYPVEAEKYESNDVRLLMSLCRELQRATGDGPFYLSCRTAGRLMGADYKNVSRWLNYLAREQVLQVVEKGSAKTQKATRWRYLYST